MRILIDMKILCTKIKVPENPILFSSQSGATLGDVFKQQIGASIEQQLVGGARSGLIGLINDLNVKYNGTAIDGYKNPKTKRQIALENLERANPNIGAR